MTDNYAEALRRIQLVMARLNSPYEQLKKRGRDVKNLHHS